MIWGCFNWRLSLISEEANIWNVRMLHGDAERFFVFAFVFEK